MASLKSRYLIGYNAILAGLWLTLALRILAINPFTNHEKIYANVGGFAEFIQTAALLEVLHSAIGIVRAPLIPTFIQTVAKNLVLWTIVHPFPQITSSPAYTLLLLTWSTSEVIRYGYFTLMLSGFSSSSLVWLRYSAFIVIYPLGIGCEMWLVSSAITECDLGWLRGVMWFELGLYAPGSYFLYTYMLKQRTKVLKEK